jgi:hypothetical protein
MGQPPFRQGDGIIIEKVQRVGKRAEKRSSTRKARGMPPFDKAARSAIMNTTSQTILFPQTAQRAAAGFDAGKEVLWQFFKSCWV